MSDTRKDIEWIQEASKSIAAWGAKYGTYAPLEKLLAELADTMESMLSQIELLEKQHEYSGTQDCLDRIERLEKVLAAAQVVLDEADYAALAANECVSPIYIQETMQKAIAACKSKGKE